MAPAPWDVKRQAQAMIEPTSDSDTRTPFEGKQSGEIARTDFDRVNGQHHPGPFIQQRKITLNDQQASDASRAMIGSNREEEYSSGDDDSAHHVSARRSSEDGAAIHRSSDDGNDNDSRQKREKRLAMNRASARERRRRKRIHTEDLELRVIALSRQCSSLQKTNEGLQLYVAKLESNLAQANATISIFGNNDASLKVPPRPPLEPLLPPVSRGDPLLGGTMQEQDRVRSLLGIIQRQEQASTASRLAPNIAGRLTHQDEDVQRRVMLDILSRQLAQQQHLRPPDAGLASLVASRAGREPPLAPAMTSLLGRAAPPATRGGTSGGDSALASYLSTLQRGEANPLRMLNFAAGGGAGRRVNDAALHSMVEAAIATEQRGVPNASAPPPKKRRKEHDK